MGCQRLLNKDGGFSISLYETYDKYESIVINGVTAKVIRKKGDTSGQGGLPSYADTSSMYFKEGPNGDIIQGAFYGNDRRIRLNFDWGHDHYNDPKHSGNGRRFSKGVVHIQTYTVDQEGKIVRQSNNARLMSNAEMKKFGPIIKHFNPTVKFRNKRKKANKKG